MSFAFGIAVELFVCVVVLASCCFWISRFVDEYEQALAEEEAERISGIHLT